ncbi:MAG: coproporphyrinogen III oxidase [Paraglaciecola sp.]|jgi:coproporphyrinogen III oxidase
MRNKEQIAERFKSLQDRICSGIERADGQGLFQEDKWERPGGGGGRSRVLTHGQIIEKGGVNFSSVEGITPIAIQKGLSLPEGQFFATGVSIVLHPANPHVPIIHMNVRYFELDNGMYWFGGGIDLTPHYIDQEDAIFFHCALKQVCDQAHPSYYDRFKKWADDYFFLKHRNETRGIGGIFFDRLSENEEMTFDQIWNFVQSVGDSFTDIYTQLMKKNHSKPYDNAATLWQSLRRGRYVEFNLVWDKGTRFGLDTDGRTESILMSMPPIANWQYNYQPEAGSAEHQTQTLLKKGIDWVKQ